MGSKAVFLNRDGTIAEDVNYCKRVEDFHVLPTVPEAIKILNRNDFKIIVVTNQSGIARGFFTEKTLLQIHRKMEYELSKSEARIDAIYYCPHHPNDGCECRKPKTGLFLEAARKLDIDLSSSFVIGNTQMDVSAGKALCSKTVLVTTGPYNGGGIIDPPNFVANNLLDAVRWIVQQQTKQISVLIPALNEREAIKRTVQAIPKAELEGMGYEVEVLVIDNGSTDGSGGLAKQAGATVVFEGKRGYGYAYKAGFARAKGEIIATADADLTYPVEDIPRLVRILENEKLDFLTTNRFALMRKGAMSLQNRLGNAILSTAVRILFRLKMADPESGMWVFRKSVLRNLCLGSNIWPFSHELKLEACYFNKCRWKEVPIEYRPRVGKTKLLDGWNVGFTDLFHIVKKRFAR